MNSFLNRRVSDATSIRPFAYGVIVASLALAALLIPRGPGCDGDFPRHVLHGLAKLRAGTWESMSWPPFPMMDLFHGTLALLLKLPSASDPRLNLVSWLVALVNLGLFVLIARHYLDPGDRSTLVIRLALMAAHPIFLIAAGTIGDYQFTLVTIQLAWLCVLRGELAVGALVTGIASGFRMSNCVWALPLAIIVWRRQGWSRSAGFLLAAGLAGFFVWLGTLMQLHFDVSGFSGGYSELRDPVTRLKTAFSKILAFWGLPLVLVTLAVCRREDWARSRQRLTAFPELLVALMLQLAVFAFLPSELGYLITTLPLLVLFLPLSELAWRTSLQLLAVFLLNFSVLDIQNKIPTRLHAAHGYWVSEYTCHGPDTALEAFRFSWPAGYYAVGDWAQSARPPEHP